MSHVILTGFQIELKSDPMHLQFLLKNTQLSHLPNEDVHMLTWLVMILSSLLSVVPNST